MSDIIREGQLRERRDLQDSLYRYQGIFLFKKNAWRSFLFWCNGRRYEGHLSNFSGDPLVIFLWDFLGRNHKHFWFYCKIHQLPAKKPKFNCILLNRIFLTRILYFEYNVFWVYKLPWKSQWEILVDLKKEINE